MTERGAALAREAITVVEGVDRAFFRPVSDRTTLLTMLRALGSG
ncbi:hypothetical protein ABZ860_15880 [Microbispora sp. NPDC046973]